MSSRFLRIVAMMCVFAMALGVLSLALGAAPPMTALAQDKGAPDKVRLQHLASVTGRDAVRLDLVEESGVTLLNGRQIVRLKAVDRLTGEIVGATFEGDRLVDEQQLRAEAAAQWRAAHGALTPELAAKLSTMRPGEKVNIAVWLVADIEPLPKSEYRSPAQNAGPVPSTAETPGSYLVANPAVGTPGDSKALAVPIPLEDAPAEVLARLGLPAAASPGVRPETPKSLDDVESHAADPNSPAQSPGATAEQAEAFRQQNADALRAQVAPIRARFLDLLRARGLTAQYASDIAPTAYLAGVTRSQIEELARLPEIDAIYLVPNVAGPSLSNARPTQNVHLIDSVGYNGNGVSVAVVEGERAYFANPYLPLAAAFDGAQPYAAHPTGVSGIIKSTHSAQRGLAYSATVYSANGSYSDFGVMSAALDWGYTQTQVLNNSYYWQDNGSSSSLFTLDRHIDYIVRYGADFAAVAAGNFGGAPCAVTPYVATPGKGYNAFTVGNYDDNDTLTWSDDFMNSCSSYGDPGHAKPEVAAVGSIISSTLTSSNPATAVGPIGSGTSYASPMVVALAADLIDADSNLLHRPEVVRSLIMATALHNIEGDARYSDFDGAGGIDGSAAIASVERHNWDDRPIDSTTTFPITFTQYVYKGERMRFVINWLSNPDVSYTTDSLPADLDLIARRANGTVITSSVSAANNFEIVDFVAPASETYQFIVTRFGGWSGGGTWLGSGWWRGTYRIVPEVGYFDTAAPPLGLHLSVYPTDWSVTAYWRAFGIRSSDSDHDLTLYTASWFDDPSTRTQLVISNFGANAVDFVVVDGNHRSSSLPEHYRVNRYNGSGGYSLSWSDPGLGLSSGLYGPYSLNSDNVVKVFDVGFSGNRGKRISAIPITNTNDLAMELFVSNSGGSSTWTQGRGFGVRSADAYGVGYGVEQLTYRLPSSSFDWLGLVVYSKAEAPAQFYVLVEDLNVYLPALLKQ